MGNVILAASKSSSGGSYVFLLAIVVLFGLLYFVTIRPQRNRQRRVMETQREVGTGARVRTTAGMYATVVAVDGDDVILEIAPGVEVRYLRRAIMEVIGDMGTQAPAAGDEQEDAPDEPGDASPDGASPDGASLDGASGRATAAPGDHAVPGPGPAEKEQPAG